MKNICLLVVFLLICQIGFTQKVPNGFSYQAIARNKDGTPLSNATISVKFSIGSNFSETYTNVSTNEFGLITPPIIIGSKNGTPKLEEIDWKLPYTIKVEIISPNGEKITSEAPLLTVPYAFIAQKVIEGGSGQVYQGSGTIDVTGTTIAIKQGIIPTTLPPNGAAEQDLRGTYPKPFVSGLQGRPISATAPIDKQVLKWNGTAWTPAPDEVGTIGSGLQSVTSNTPLSGLGTSNDPLKINDKGIGTDKLADGAVTAAKLASMGATNGQVLKWDGSTWMPRNDSIGSGGTDSWKISGNNIYRNIGNVGIGVTTPNEKLHLSDGFFRIDRGGVDIYKSSDELYPFFTNRTDSFYTNGFAIYRENKVKTYVGAKKAGYIALYDVDGDGIHKATPIVSLSSHDFGGKYGYIGLGDVINSRAAIFLDTINRKGVAYADTVKVVESLYPDATSGTVDLGKSNKVWRCIYLLNPPSTCSDIRLKDQINNINYGLTAVSQLRPVIYQFKKDNSKQEQLGFIAQEVEKIIPQVVQKPTDPNGYYAMKYEQLIPVLTKAIQEQQQQIEALKSENGSLKKEMDSLKADISDIKKLLNQGKTSAQN